MDFDRIAYAKRRLAECREQVTRAEALKSAAEAQVERYDLERERCQIDVEALEEWIQEHE